MVARGAQGSVAGRGMDHHWSEGDAERGRAVRFPRPPALADRNGRGDLPVDDRRMAAAGVTGAVSGHGAHLFAVRDLVQQLGQNGAVAVAAGGEFHRPDV